MKTEIKIALGVLALIAGFFFFKFALLYLMPFILAVVVAIMIEPVVNFFQKRLHLSRGLAVSLVLVLVLIIFAIFIIAGLSGIYVELNKLAENFPSYQVIWEQFQWIMSHNDELGGLMNRLQLSAGQQEAVNQILQDIYVGLTENVKAFIGEALGLLAKLPNIFTVTIVSFIATFFISRDRRLLANLFWRLFPDKWQTKMRSAKDEIIDASFGFIRAEFILISITTIIAIIGLEILNSNYALIIGFASGLLDLIPVIGPTLIFIPWAIYSMLTGNIGYGIGLLAVYGVMAVVRQVAEVKLIGKSIGVHPLATLVALYLGMKIFGVSGVLIGPAIVIILKALIKSRIITIYQITKG